MLVSSARAQSRILLAGAAVLVLALFYFRSSLHIREHVDYWIPHGAKGDAATESSTTSPSDSAPTFIPLPGAYTARPKQEPFCAALFSPAYLYNLSRNRTSHCDPSQSTSTLECFSTHITNERGADTFCVASNVAFNRREKKFYLDCAIDAEAPFYEPFTKYMMETGLPYVFEQHFDFDQAERVQRSKSKNAVGYRKEKKFGVVARREGAGSVPGSAANTWHNLMELSSYYLSMDALSVITSPHAEDKGAAYYNPEVDKANTQVIVVDSHQKGPYFDLWDVFSDTSRNPTLKLSEDGSSVERLGEEAEQQEVLEFLDRVILPLPGASNPFWEGTWDAHSCSQSDLARVFSDRVLNFYNATTHFVSEDEFSTVSSSIEETEMDLSALPPAWTKKTHNPLNVLVVTRAKSRRIDDLEGKLSKLRSMFPAVTFNVRDLSDYTFAEQVRLVHSHQIFVGVHGAAMTQLLFLPRPPSSPSSTVVEILPHGLPHRGYRNLALMLGHRYLSVHADNDMGGQDFHDLDIEVKEGKYIDAVATAVKGLFHRGMEEADIETQ